MRLHSLAWGAVAATALSIVGCRSAEVRRDPGAAPAEAPWEAASPLAPLPAAPLGVSADFESLPWKITPEKVRLGRWLFYDRRLSADGSVSCATCHRPENAFSEPTPHSTGVGGKVGGRKSPGFVNGAFPIYPVWFWDGRAASLAEQAKGPMVNPVEMASTHEKVVATIAAIPGYRRAFAQAFGDDGVDIDRVAEAIASYEATRLSGNSAYDRFDAGDATALTPQQRLGREVFFEKAQCNACHLGPNFTDSRFHNLGVGWKPPPAGKDPIAGFEDVGRYAVTHDPEDIGAFKTPGLRDCTKHGPYMHDGSLATLRDVVLHYDQGGIQNPWLGPELRPLSLTAEEVDALVAFLGALDGEGYQDALPASFPR